VPHGGLHQAGRVIGQTLGRLEIPRRCVILGPNHTGWGAPWSLMADGAYATPLGDVPIDEELAGRLLERCTLLQADDLAHRGEHSIEVLLPFLRQLGPPDLMITPIVIRSEEAEEFDLAADAMATCLRRLEEPVLVIASADLAHYEPREAVQQKDAEVIKAIAALDSRVAQHRLRQVTSCSLAPVACVLGAARGLGATEARLVCYGTSADAGGDPQSATGYAGIIIT